MSPTLTDTAAPPDWSPPPGVAPLTARSFIAKVAGVSFHQQTVRHLYLDQPLWCVREPDNPHDPHAVIVLALAGVVGHLPRDLASRLSATGPGPWPAQVSEILPGQNAWGVRARVWARVDEDTPVPPGPPPPPVWRTVPTAGSAATAPEQGPVPEPVQGPAATVRSASGRILGTLIDRDGERARVQSPAGTITSYPCSVIRIDAA